MKKSLLAIPLILLLAFAAIPLAAQDSPSQISAPSRDTINAVVWSEAGIQAATVLESFGYSEAWFPYVFLGTASLQHLPGIIAGADGSLVQGAVQLGLDAALFTEHLALGDPIADAVLGNAAHKFAMFGAYENYATLRASSTDAAYRDGFTRYTFGDLVTAPFDPGALGKWQVLGYVGGILAYGVVAALTGDQGSAIWNTGVAYLGDTQVPAWAGALLMFGLQVINFTMTGVGEESLYRGTFYEEMKLSAGEWPARILDASLFSLSHVPQTVANIKPEVVGNLVLNFGLSCLQTLWLQTIYQDCGLRSAVAAHAWSDVVLFFSSWLMKGGVKGNDLSGFSLTYRL